MGGGRNRFAEFPEHQAVAFEANNPPDVVLDLAESFREAAAEITRLTAENERLRGDIQQMVEKAADNNLEGYRELGARAAAAEAERDEARGKVELLERIVLTLGNHLLDRGGRDLLSLDDLEFFGTKEDADPQDFAMWQAVLYARDRELADYRARALLADSEAVGQ